MFKSQVVSFTRQIADMHLDLFVFIIMWNLGENTLFHKFKPEIQKLFFIMTTSDKTISKEDFNTVINFK